MKIPVHIAEKLLLLSQGEILPSGSVKHSLIDELVIEGIIERNGRIKKLLRLHDNTALENYLKNKCSIGNLSLYIETCRKEEITRSELVLVSSDSKLWRVRTFKGFLVNCYSPIQATLNRKQIILNPVEGTFQFIYDCENFLLSPDITVVGIENPENFRHIGEQNSLFNDITPLFVSRYPQNQCKDLITWLQSISNSYLHFGDFDFAGIGIYQNEFKRHLANKATFFVPENIDELIKEFGSKKRYDEQKINFNVTSIQEKNLLQLIGIIHKYKKGLDQEIFTKNI